MSAPGSVRQGFPCWGQSFPFIHFFFFIGFVSDVSRVFVVAVSHGLGPNLAAVRGFRRQYSEVETLLRQALWAICRRCRLLAGACLFVSFFFNGFRKTFRSFCSLLEPNLFEAFHFETLFFLACAKVFRANLFLSFFFLFNGFRKRRFESFCGGGFAWLGPESCCCSRLSQAVLQGQISRRF